MWILGVRGAPKSDVRFILAWEGLRRGRLDCGGGSSRSVLRGARNARRRVCTRVRGVVRELRFVLIVRGVDKGRGLFVHPHGLDTRSEMARAVFRVSLVFGRRHTTSYSRSKHRMQCQ